VRQGRLVLARISLAVSEKEALGKDARRARAAQTKKPTDRLGRGGLIGSSVGVNSNATTRALSNETQHPLVGWQPTKEHEFVQASEFQGCSKVQMVTCKGPGVTPASELESAQLGQVTDSESLTKGSEE
jgi:hypothetical protein